MGGKMATERKSIPLKSQVGVWARDNWHCRYCGNPVFFAPTLKLLENINPGHSYFHPNGKEGKLLPLFQWSWASVDHVLPVSAGGKNEIGNYVTACWKCNLKLGDKLEKPKLQEITKSDWDGFYGLYAKLSKR
ncbi:MAG: HNH endonuclease [Candidatus Micrarchaeota archaeon]